MDTNLTRDDVEAARTFMKLAYNHLIDDHVDLAQECILMALRETEAKAVSRDGRKSNPFAWS